MQERLESKKISNEQYEMDMNRVFDPKGQPKRVKPGRFFKCLEALTKFFELEVPPIITHRSSNVRLVAYGFVDASKGGFGANFWQICIYYFTTRCQNPPKTVSALRLYSRRGTYSILN